MKLRNKKTGEIVENAYIRESHDFYNKRTIAVFVRDGNNPPERVSTGYETLAELNEEWEDYEEETEAWEPNETIKTSIGDVAAEDYFEILEDGTKKTEFTWDEAMEIEKKTNGKWRLPTIFEWDKLVAEFGDKDGELDRDDFVNALNLTEDEDGNGGYWASTANSGSNGAYGLYFDSGRVYRVDYYRYGGSSVRCVAS